MRRLINNYSDKKLSTLRSDSINEVMNHKTTPNIHTARSLSPPKMKLKSVLVQEDINLTTPEITSLDQLNSKSDGYAMLIAVLCTLSPESVW